MHRKLLKHALNHDINPLLLLKQDKLFLCIMIHWYVQLRISGFDSRLFVASTNTELSAMADQLNLKGLFIIAALKVVKNVCDTATKSKPDQKMHFLCVFVRISL